MTGHNTSGRARREAPTMGSAKGIPSAVAVGFSKPGAVTVSHGYVTDADRVVSEISLGYV
jgi:hypothetical protein